MARIIAIAVMGVSNGFARAGGRKFCIRVVQRVVIKFRLAILQRKIPAINRYYRGKKNQWRANRHPQAGKRATGARITADQQKKAAKRQSLTRHRLSGGPPISRHERSMPNRGLGPPQAYAMGVAERKKNMNCRERPRAAAITYGQKGTALGQVLRTGTETERHAHSQEQSLRSLPRLWRPGVDQQVRWPKIDSVAADKIIAPLRTCGPEPESCRGQDRIPADSDELRCSAPQGRNKKMPVGKCTKPAAEGVFALYGSVCDAETARLPALDHG